MTEQEKKILYLHVGMPKTGTSALQSFFKLNSDRLKAQGIIYPETGQFDDYSHHNIPFSLAKNNYKAALPKSEQAAFLNELEEEVKNYPRVLLSSENFSMLCNNHTFYRFLCLFETRIICYLRRQDSFAESHYKQVLADPALPDLHCKVDKHVAKLHPAMTYFPFVGAWARLGTPLVRVYEKERFVDGNIFSDFCDVINIKIDDSFVFPEENINPTESNAFVELMRLLKAHNALHSVLDILSMDELRDLVTDILSNDPTVSFLSQKKRIAILKKYAKSNRKIAQTYLNRDELFSDPNFQESEQTAFAGLSEQELFVLLSKIIYKASVEPSLGEKWEYREGMTENDIFFLFSHVLNIKGTSDYSKKSFFTLPEKILGRLFPRKGHQ